MHKVHACSVSQIACTCIFRRLTFNITFYVQEETALREQAMSNFVSIFTGPSLELAETQALVAISQAASNLLSNSQQTSAQMLVTQAFRDRFLKLDCHVVHLP